MTPNEGFMINPGFSSCRDSFGCGAMAIPPSSAYMNLYDLRIDETFKPTCLPPCVYEMTLAITKCSMKPLPSIFIQRFSNCSVYVVISVTSENNSHLYIYLRQGLGGMITHMKLKCLYHVSSTCVSHMVLCRND